MMLIGQLMLVLLVQVMNMGLFRKLMKMRLVLLGQVMKMGSSRQLTKMRLVLLGQVKMRLFRQSVKMRLFRQLVKMRLFRQVIQILLVVMGSNWLKSSTVGRLFGKHKRPWPRFADRT